MRVTRDAVADGVTAGICAAVGSGGPSTVHALLTGASPLEAGTLLRPRETRPVALVLAAVPAYLALSLSWGIALAVALPRRRTIPAGALAGLAIAALDLGVFGRRFPRIRALPPWPQVADHAAYGMIVGIVVARRRAARGRADAQRRASRL